MSSRGYLVLTLVGAAVALGHTAVFIALHGVDVRGFVEPLLHTNLGQVVAGDLLLLTIAFLVWSWRDARQRELRGWPFVLLATIFIAVSCGLPLYLYLRERQRAAAVAT